MTHGAACLEALQGQFMESGLCYKDMWMAHSVTILITLETQGAFRCFLFGWLISQKTIFLSLT